MIFLPWVVFLLGVAWMIYDGFKAKKEYLVEQAKRQQKQPSTDDLRTAAH